MNDPRPFEKAEPPAPAINELLEEEELDTLDEPEVPDEVKAEILERVERRHDAALEKARPQ